MRDELQELVDRVAGLLGAPATLEDADFTLLAFCAHPVDGAETPLMDAVRTRSILGRGSTPTGLDLADGDAPLLLSASLRRTRLPGS